MDKNSSEYFRIKVIPGSSKNELKEIMEDGEGGKTYKIRVKAAPEKGKANKELISFLSQHFNVPKEKISILSGKTEQLKLIKIESETLDKN